MNPIRIQNYIVNRVRVELRVRDNKINNIARDSMEEKILNGLRNKGIEITISLVNKVNEEIDKQVNNK